MIEKLSVSLSGWIVQDGNYGDFSVDKTASFALEFYGKLGPSPFNTNSSRLVAEGNASYRAVGQVVHRDHDWWVVDFGLPMFQEQAPPPGAQVGDWFFGIIKVSVDPFLYFERLSKRPASPGPIFDWVIERIDKTTTPFVEKSPRVFVRDPTRPSIIAVQRTDAWNDDDGLADYALHCKRLPGPARRTLRKA